MIVDTNIWNRRAVPYVSPIDATNLKIKVDNVIAMVNTIIKNNDIDSDF